MSRSFKKTPYANCNSKSHRSKHPMKNYANKKVRHMEDLPSKGSGYKKFFESWDICDYCEIMTKEQAIQYYEKLRAAAEVGDTYAQGAIKKWPTLEDYLKVWRKNFLQK